MAVAGTNPFGYEAEFTHAVILDSGLVMTSGEAATDDSGNLIVENFSAQVRRTLQNLDAVLTSAGSSLAQVLRMTVYLRRAGDMKLFREVRREFFGAPFPAIAAVVVADFPLEGMLVQIEALASRNERFSATED